MPDGDLWLLIGNSRWHWAEASGRASARSGPQGLRFSHSLPPADPASLPWQRLRAWAAVGPLPFQGKGDSRTPEGVELRRLQPASVPLHRLPPWLGIDRALVGWQAWRNQGCHGGGAVLVADAGTALSLTRVGGNATFLGGRLQPGLSTQLSSLGLATEFLPQLAPSDPWFDRLHQPEDLWPAQTEPAMRVGCLLGLAAAVAQAWRELERLEPTALWLTGGDAPGLVPLLQQADVPLQLAPNLALEALVDLSSGPDQ